MEFNLRIRQKVDKDWHLQEQKLHETYRNTSKENLIKMNVSELSFSFLPKSAVQQNSKAMPAKQLRCHHKKIRKELLDYHLMSMYLPILHSKHNLKMSTVPQ